MQTPVSDIIQTGDLGGHKIAMSFDDEAVVHLMGLLTEAYSDPVGAVIREYATNALDAHIEAGNPDPIKIFTPSAFSPTFRVVDRGTGLSVNDIENMYSKYGASTKRGTNAQVGMLGIGAKSGLALVPQFNIISVKNGVKISVLVSRDTDGAGQMEIIDTRATNEPNGVEISIPIQRSEEFSNKCRDFFRFWEPGTVLVNDREPSVLTGRKVGTKFIINKDLSKDYVVMGNVAYPVKDGIYRHDKSYYYQPLGIVARVDIGDVNFTPSREDLRYTSKTKSTLARLNAEFRQDLSLSAQKDVDLQTTHVGAWSAAIEWWKTFGIKGLTYKGNELHHAEIEVSKGKSYRYSQNLACRYQRNVSSVGPKDADNTIFVTNFSGANLKLSPVQRKKIRAYCESKSISGIADIVVVADKSLKPSKITISNAAIVDEFITADWDSIRPIKIQRDARPGVVRAEPYDLFVDGYRTVPITNLDAKTPIIFYSPAELSYPTWLPGRLPEGAQIIVIARNRWDKFKRDWPTAVHYKQSMRERMDALIARLTVADKIKWHYDKNWVWVTASRWDAAKIDDPDIKQWIAAMQAPYTDAASKLRAYGSHREGSLLPNVPTEGSNPLTKYPMSDNLRSIDKEHAYWYLNSFYNHLSNKEN